MTAPVYLDYLATTPVDPRVAEAMGRCLTLDGTFGNPASRSHRFGWEAEMAVEAARRDVAALIGADLREIVWTSGATESDNLAIRGAIDAARAAGNKRPHIVTSAIEHRAVLAAELDHRLGFRRCLDIENTPVFRCLGSDNSQADTRAGDRRPDLDCLTVVPT